MRTALVVAALMLARAAAASPTASFDYLYLEANEGGSSGGHVAIRFGDETYHFQQVSLGLLKLQRDDSADFRHRYAGIENRTIHVSRVAVPSESYRTLRIRFAERYLREQKLFAHHEALRDDGVVLAALLARRRGNDGAGIAIRGAGYFLPDESPERSHVLHALRDRVEATYGTGTLQRRAGVVRDRLRRGQPVIDDRIEIPPEGYPSFPRTYSERYRDLATELVALDVLERGLPLRPDAKRSGTTAELQIDDGERRSLQAFAGRLADALVRLVGSDRPDTGLALLIGMARLEALDETLRSGRLVLLDVFPPDSAVVPSPLRQLDALSGMRAEAALDLAGIRARLAADLTEGDFAALEAAADRVMELDGAIAGAAALRVTAGSMQPSREATWSDLVEPAVSDAQIEDAIAAADIARHQFAAALRQQLGYNLVTHNCVSELFQTVGAAGVHLGRNVGSPWSLDFIPFVSARAVDERWDVVERQTLPSYRHARLEAMVHRHGWWSRVRESNVVSSTIYRRNDADSTFLFFTDDAPLARPVLGAVNVLVGIGAGVAGLAVLPVDGARLLSAGLRGLLYSVPELAFVNVRKGSFDYVPLAGTDGPG